MARVHGRGVCGRRHAWQGGMNDRGHVSQGRHVWQGGGHAWQER